MLPKIPVGILTHGLATGACIYASVMTFVMIDYFIAIPIAMLAIKMVADYVKFQLGE